MYRQWMRIVTMIKLNIVQFRSNPEFIHILFKDYTSLEHAYNLISSSLQNTDSDSNYYKPGALSIC